MSLPPISSRAKKPKDTISTRGAKIKGCWCVRIRKRVVESAEVVGGLISGRGGMRAVLSTDSSHQGCSASR
jgi:hypothetical protein